MRILSILTLSLVLGGFAFAQQSSRSAKPAKPQDEKPAAPMDSNKGDENSSSETLTPTSVAARTGIRFVLKTAISLPSKVYMPLAKNKLEVVDLRTGLPGRRSLYPKGRKISLYGGISEKGIPEDLLVSKQIPDNFGSKTLALIGKNSSGKLTIDFIDEKELPLNAVYIQNQTGRTYTLEINPKTKDQKNVELAPGQVYIFGKDNNDKYSKSTPVHLTYMMRLKNGKTTKIKDRGFMLTTFPNRKVILAISPDDKGRTAVLSELMIYKEHSTPAAADGDKK